MSKKELARLWSETQRKGMTLVPLVLYFNHKGIAKMKIGIAKGKQTHDKRADEAKLAELLPHGRIIAIVGGSGGVARLYRILLADEPLRGLGAIGVEAAAEAALGRVRYSWREKVELLPRVVPFLVIIVGVLVALYGGIATPSETAMPPTSSGK